MTNKALVEALRADPVQVWRDAYIAVYGCEPTHPTEMYSAAHAIIRKAIDTALASATEAPSGGDKELVEPEALVRFRAAFGAETGAGRMFTLDDAREIVAHIDRLSALSSAPATGEREQIAAFLERQAVRYEEFAAGLIDNDQIWAWERAAEEVRMAAKAITRGDHRTQSGEMEGGEHG